MSRPSFIYVTYINSTPERVWQALTAESSFGHTATLSQWERRLKPTPL